MKDDRAYGNDFGTDESKGSLGHNSPPTKESTFSTGNALVLDKRTGIFPVPEANAIAIGTTSKVKHDAKNNEACNGDHFDRTTWVLGGCQ